ncbi:hypothetical protein [Streptomyces europaeiscabiei]|uniref:hypothetical protein n=1 Tax=Streptomyces europaeiscabiei TaxID=146819 RepID=UPI0029BAB371|nr:hypothetical protein [Streptomyces europaeiscabiei]MDX3585974.1 hypothetical protein [Streptomyces europaeiscabiei]
MGRVRLTRVGRARAGVLTGGGMITAGVWVGIDLAAGLMAGGMLLVLYCLLLADVDLLDRDGGGP